jgi:hypothetical protein
MMRGEANMAHSPSSRPRFFTSQLAWLVAAPLLIVTLPARSGASLDEAPASAVATQAVPITAPVADVAAAVVPAAAIVAPAAGKPESGDQQRRVLMLLLMNSAGPVRPYGNLGH